MLTAFNSLRSAHFAQRTGIKYTQHRIPMHIHHKSPLARLSCRAELCERIPPGTYLAIPLARQGTAKEGLEQHQLSTIDPEDGLEGSHGTTVGLRTQPASEGTAGDGACTASVTTPSTLRDAPLAASRAPTARPGAPPVRLRQGTSRGHSPQFGPRSLGP